MNELKPKKAAPKAGTKKRTPARKPLNPKTIQRQVQDVLLELMRSGESETVRITAAKALMDKLKADETNGPSSRSTRKNKRSEIVAEARAVLDAFADGKSGGVGEPPEVDQDGAISPADAEG